MRGLGTFCICAFTPFAFEHLRLRRLRCRFSGETCAWRQWSLSSWANRYSWCGRGLITIEWFQFSRRVRLLSLKIHDVIVVTIVVKTRRPASGAKSLCPTLIACDLRVSEIKASGAAAAFAPLPAVRVQTTALYLRGPLGSNRASTIPMIHPPIRRREVRAAVASARPRILARRSTRGIVILKVGAEGVPMRRPAVNPLRRVRRVIILVRKRRIQPRVVRTHPKHRVPAKRQLVQAEQHIIDQRVSRDLLGREAQVVGMPAAVVSVSIPAPRKIDGRDVVEEGLAGRAPKRPGSRRAFPLGRSRGRGLGGPRRRHADVSRLRLVAGVDGQVDAGASAGRGRRVLGGLHRRQSRRGAEPTRRITPQWCRGTAIWQWQ